MRIRYIDKEGKPAIREVNDSEIIIKRISKVGVYETGIYRSYHITPGIIVQIRPYSIDNDD